MLSQEDVDVVASIPGLAWFSDERGETLSVNTRLRDYFGIQESHHFHILNHLVHPEDAAQTKHRWLFARKSGVEFYATQRFLGRDGAYHWFRVAANPKQDRHGLVVGWYGTLLNIDDQKIAEEALRLSEENLRSILDNIPAMIATADGKGNQEYNNKASTEYIGLDADRLSGLGFLDIIHPDDRDDFESARNNCIRDSIPMDHKIRAMGRDGTYRWVQVRVRPVFDENGIVTRWYGLQTDIDDQVKALERLRSAQEKLARASQIASLAELSASIAHEVNQPLSAAVTNSHALQRWLSADPPNLERARNSALSVAQDAMAAAAVVGRVRALFSQRKAVKTLINLNEVIGEVRKLVNINREIDGTVIETHLDSELPLTLADPVQIQQLVFNLVRNGIDATKANNALQRLLEIRSYTAGPSIHVEVRDNGSGLSEPNRIFEPFYSTKAGGMGMGLAICRSIVEAHQGRLWAESVSPRGTAFSFTLPIQSDAAV